MSRPVKSKLTAVHFVQQESLETACFCLNWVLVRSLWKQDSETEKNLWRYPTHNKKRRPTDNQ